MIVTLLKQEGMNSISLPEKIKGQYWIMNYVSEEIQNPLISIEGINEQWVLKSNKKVQVLDDNGQRVREMIIEAYNLYCLYLQEHDTYEYLFVEPVTEDRKQYTKYLVKAARDIYIGRGQSNQIHFQNIVVDQYT